MQSFGYRFLGFIFSEFLSFFLLIACHFNGRERELNVHSEVEMLVCICVLLSPSMIYLQLCINTSIGLLSSEVALIMDSLFKLFKLHTCFAACKELYGSLS